MRHCEERANAEVTARKLKMSNSSPQSARLSAVEVDYGTYRSTRYCRVSFTVHREVQLGDNRRGTEYNRKAKLRLLIRDATLNGVFREFIASVYLLTSSIVRHAAVRSLLRTLLATRTFFYN